MKGMLLHALLIWLASCGICYAVDTYFPGGGPPSSASVETEPPKYYAPQQAQPNPDDEPYDNPTQPINPNVNTPNPQSQQ